MTKRAQAVANTMATLLALDSLSYIELGRAGPKDPANIDKQYHASMYALFAELREETNMDYLYTQYKINGTNCVFLLDGEEQENYLLAIPGSQDTMIFTECAEVFQNATTISTEIIEHKRWGTSVFAHAPIIDKRDNSVIGLVTAGFSIATLKSNMQNIFFLILGLFSLIIILVSLALCIVLRLREHSLDTEYLTKLGTKHYFENQLIRVANHAKSTKTPFSLLMLDIDGFKLINDTHGHLSGDRVLQIVASIIRSSVQVTDSCSRIGGDEFAVILTASSLKQALLTAQAIQNTVREYTTEDIPGLVLSISIGAAQWDENHTIQDLIEQADQALYKAKNQKKTL
ncbi:MAG TPA: GGDEF domain-containing protein [Sphaerochaeta sp.]|nr:GGDEF domain-containing protein [Sphaerochaeta sp.]